MIIFRVDGNEKIGLGHIMRCMSIADALIKIGEECLFVLADIRGEIIVKNRGFKTFVMNTKFDCMEMEFQKIQSVIEQKMPKCIVIDSYFVTEKYLHFLGTLGKIVYIDDLAAFAYPVNSLINYNIYSTRIDYYTLYKEKHIKLPKCILGTKYTPLRKEFKEIPEHILNREVKDILISTGGADPMHLALGIVKFLVEHLESIGGIRFHIVLGMMNKDKNKIMELVGEIENIIIHSSVQDMKSLMLICDLAVSAAGSTLYELCACGTPTITYVFADNQILGADAFEKSGMMVSVGDIRGKQKIIPTIIEAIFALAGDYKKREEMGKQMQKFVDGNGAERLARELMKIV